MRKKVFLRHVNTKVGIGDTKFPESEFYPCKNKSDGAKISNFLTDCKFLAIYLQKMFYGVPWGTQDAATTLLEYPSTPSRLSLKRFLTRPRYPTLLDQKS